MTVRPTLADIEALDTMFQRAADGMGEAPAKDLFLFLVRLGWNAQTCGRGYEKCLHYGGSRLCHQALLEHVKSLVLP